MPPVPMIPVPGMVIHGPEEGSVLLFEQLALGQIIDADLSSRAFSEESKVGFADTGLTEVREISTAAGNGGGGVRDAGRRSGQRW